MGHRNRAGNCPAWRAIYTDCKSNLAILARGKQWATSAKRAAARVWRSIFHVLDDDPELAEKIIWLPAHKTRQQIGVATKSDGIPISALDWLANMAADEIAKSAAQSVRVPGDVLAKLTEATYKSQRLRTNPRT